MQCHCCSAVLCCVHVWPEGKLRLIDGSKISPQQQLSVITLAVCKIDSMSLLTALVMRVRLLLAHSYSHHMPASSYCESIHHHTTLWRRLRLQLVTSGCIMQAADSSSQQEGSVDEAAAGLTGLKLQDDVTVRVILRAVSAKCVVEKSNAGQ